MRRPPLIAAAIIFAVGGGAGRTLAQTADATPLRMRYCVTEKDGRFDYRIDLVLENLDGSWVPGQGFGWIVFGDAVGGAPGPAQSPLSDFQLDAGCLPIGPFHMLTVTGGFHNGPTLAPLVQSSPPFPPNLWVPGAVGDTLTWRGTSSVDLGPGELLWSNVQGSSGAVLANFRAAAREDCPAPPGCYPDCNRDGSLTVADFGCFQTSIAAGAPYADCNGDSMITVADFGCFQTQFVLGCP